MWPDMLLVVSSLFQNQRAPEFPSCVDICALLRWTEPADLYQRSNDIYKDSIQRAKCLKNAKICWYKICVSGHSGGC